MIFGKDYDLSLWYMLKVKNIYGKKTIEFIKELPEELLENVRTICLNGIKHNFGSYDCQDEFYNVKSDTTPNTYYKFYIMCRDLYIYKYQIIGGMNEDVFSLVLSPNNSKDIMNMSKSDDRVLGSICTGQYPKMSFKEVDYELKKTEFGYIILHTYVLLSNLLNIKFIWPTSISNMPDEIYRDSSHSKKLILLPHRSDSNIKY